MQIDLIIQNITFETGISYTSNADTQAHFKELATVINHFARTLSPEIDQVASFGHNIGSSYHISLDIENMDEELVKKLFNHTTHLLESFVKKYKECYWINLRPAENSLKFL